MPGKCFRNRYMSVLFFSLLVMVGNFVSIFFFDELNVDVIFIVIVNKLTNIKWRLCPLYNSNM